MVLVLMVISIFTNAARGSTRRLYSDFILLHFNFVDKGFIWWLMLLTHNPLDKATN